MNTKDCRGEIRQTIQAEGWTATDIAEYIQAIADRDGIPVNVTTDQVKSGGLFGSFYPCVLISHPNPPQSYFQHMIIINGNIINFQFWGMSKANYNSNMKEMHRNEGLLTGLVKSAFYQHGEMALQTEMLWHNQINNIYEEIWFGRE